MAFPRGPPVTEGPGRACGSRLFLTSQESQAIPLVSVASVAAGKAKKQTCCGPEERPDRPLRSQESCDPGTARGARGPRPGGHAAPGEPLGRGLRALPTGSGLPRWGLRLGKEIHASQPGAPCGWCVTHSHPSRHRDPALTVRETVKPVAPGPPCMAVRRPSQSGRWRQGSRLTTRARSHLH